MSQSDYMLSTVLQKMGTLPYRKHVEYLIREHSTDILYQRARAGIAMISEVCPSIAPQIQPRMAGFIDHVNERFGLNWYFWQSATCEQAAWSLIDAGIEFLPVQPVLTKAEDALVPGPNQMLAYILYQVPTMSFAYSASTQRAQRKFMGIRKGIFG
jgi:hypothetical protein